MANPWDNDPILTPVSLDKTTPWAKDPIVSASPVEAAPEPMKFDIDFAGPVADVRSKIGALPEEHQDAAWGQYAKAAVGKEREAGYKPAPAAGYGLPIVGEFMDEAMAGLESVPNLVTGGSYGPSYSEALAIQRERERAAEEAHPVMNAVGRIGTGLVGGGAALKGGASLLGNLTRGAAAGAGYGAAAGFGAGEGGVDNRLQSGTEGAQIGAMIGTALPAAVNGVARVGTLVKDAAAPRIAAYTKGPGAAADRVLANKIKKSGKTPDDIQDYLDQGVKASQFSAPTAKNPTSGRANLPETIADSNESMQRLAGTVYRTGNEAGERVKGFLDSRQRGPRNPLDPQKGEMPGQIEDVKDAFRRANQIATSKSAYRTENDMIEAARKEADTLYTAARNSSEDFDLQPAIDGFVLKAQDYRGPFRSEMMRAVDLFADPMQQNSVRSINNITRFDAAKKQLDDLIDGSKVDHKATNLTRELTDFKHALMHRVHEPDAKGLPTKNLAYQQAREAFGSNAEAREAIDIGRRALNENSEVTLDQVRQLTPGQKKLARIGFDEAIEKRLASKKPGDNVGNIFQERRVIQLMDELTPGNKKGPQFGEYMERQGRMAQTRNIATGGSQTARNLQDDAEESAEILSTAWDKLRSAPTIRGLIMDATASGLRKAFGYRQDVALEIAKRLTETDRTKQAEILRQIGAHFKPDRMAEFNAHVNAMTRSSVVQAASESADKREAQKQIKGARPNG